MFRRKVKPLSEILGKLLREEGLEAPLLQKRIVSAWDIVCLLYTSDAADEL